MSLPDSCIAMHNCITLLLTQLHMRAALPAVWTLCWRGCRCGQSARLIAMKISEISTIICKAQTFCRPYLCVCVGSGP